MTITNETVNIPPIETVLAEKRVALYHVDWRSYEKILEALGDNRAARITYYQDMKVPEFWRYNGKALKIHLLSQDRYQESETSPTFPLLTKSTIYEFLAQCNTQGETQTKRAFRAKLREQIMTQEDS
ncbi:hypothetical protein B7486_31260 [cyanobacterium TDX16]|nr:hypothetical protein B7486_31260 [cyanobacterium TDX16]